MKYCSACLVCVSSCPFDAVSRQKESGEIKIDKEKCQVCGVCYSGCPAGAIEATYYNLDSLMDYLEESRAAQPPRAVALVCRGSVPNPRVMRDVVSMSDFIPVSVPCVGRVPVEFFLKAVSLGFGRVVVAACRQRDCHYEDGSRIINLRIRLLLSLVQQLGYGPETFTLVTLGPVAHVDETRCAVCLTCSRVCKYHAPFFDRSEVTKVEIDPDKCTGCGICVGECPAKAIEVGYERI